MQYYKIHVFVTFLVISVTSVAGEKSPKTLQGAVMKTEQFKNIKARGEAILDKEVGIKNVATLLMISKIAQGEIGYKFKNYKVDTSIRNQSVSFGVNYEF